MKRHWCVFLQKEELQAPLSTFSKNEPMIEPELMTLSNVLLTPHLGSALTEVRETIATIVVDNVMAILAEKIPPNCINPEVYTIAGC
jgi:glyoxylate reductase